MATFRARPAFALGEEVAVVNTSEPCVDTPRTEIVERLFGTFVQHRHFVKNRWGYRTANMPPVVYEHNLWLFEPNLRKLPPDDRFSWGDCVWKPEDCIASKKESIDE